MHEVHVRRQDNILRVRRTKRPFGECMSSSERRCSSTPRPAPAQNRNTDVVLPAFPRTATADAWASTIDTAHPSFLVGCHNQIAPTLANFDDGKSSCWLVWLAGRQHMQTHAHACMPTHAHTQSTYVPEGRPKPECDFNVASRC